jgi:hypothetical protein
MAVLGVIVIPLVMAVFKALQRLDASDARHALTDQRLGYIEADGRRQDLRLGRIEQMLMEVRDGVIEMRSELKK